MEVTLNQEQKDRKILTAYAKDDLNLKTTKEMIG
jgi:hypothetical protein